MKPSNVLPVLVVGTLVMLVACGGGGPNSSAPPAPTLTSITVSPLAAQITNSSAQQFTATGTYSDGSSKNLSGSVAWSSSAGTVAGISASGLASAHGVGNTTITASEGSIHASASLTVTAPPLISMSITPSTASLPLGTTLQLKAVGIFEDGSTQDVTGSVSWSSSSPAIVAVSGSGLLQSEKMGTGQVVASQGGIKAVITVTVKAAALVSLTVSPGSASIAKETAQQFSAIGVFTDGSKQDVTSVVSWTSSSSSVTVSAGLAMGLAPARASITAASGTISASAALTVTNATATSIAVTPVNPNLVVGLYQQFTATATFSDGSTQTIDGVATWISSAPTVAALKSAGLVFGSSTGTSVISATFEQLTSSSTLTVNPPSLVSISITPATATIAATTVQRFFVIGNYNDGSTQVLSGASWSSSNPTVANVSGNVATGQQPGTATISATLNSFTASASLTVTSATLVSIAVTPVNTSIAPGTTEGFSATAAFSDNTAQNITQIAGWTSSNLAAATMSGNNATGIANGNTIIGASFDGVVGSTGLTVTQGTMTALSVSPSTPTIVPGIAEQFSATATFSDGSKQQVTTTATWKSSQTSVATISGGGTATGVAAGTTTISATFNGATVSTTLTVSSASLISLSVSPTTSMIAPGTSQQFSAIGTYSDGTVQNVTAIAHWTSSDSTVASVSNSGNIGVVTAFSSGWARISAVLNSIAAAAVLNVSNATLVSLSITPANVSISLGSTQQLTATGTFSDGSTQDMTAWVTWNSSAAQVCTVNSSGLAITSGTGTATIAASFDSVSQTTTLTVY